MIERSESQQTTCIAMTEIDGERRQAASATCSIRPGKSLTFSIDVGENTGISADDTAQVTRMFSAYLADELKKAKGLGIPIE